MKNDVNEISNNILLCYVFLGLPSKRNRSNAIKRNWSEEEIKLVLQAFHKHVVGATLPGKSECMHLVSNNNILRNRTWTMVKDFLRNHKNKIARQANVKK